MTTPRDLLLIAIDSSPTGRVESGELSLALAGAELLDLLAAGAATLDEGNRIVPGPAHGLPGPLDDAASALVRRSPYESVAEWLWRRGRDLSAHYLDALEREGLLVRQRRRWPFLTPGRRTLVDSRDRTSARARWTSGDPVLAFLAQDAGISAEPPRADSPPAFGTAETSVFAALDGASAELAAERGRRGARLEEAAAENRRRGY
ncbi:GPP34 family phosphoprotein [Streptomyces sp. 8L]|uniref:GPP34 family phosphoprotein n=1 Tax=Streptomyces sp. 8L TaxID=2877242 RepID=UPI001CD6E1BB|nr:GPP34 family phosphoprotein [Streptomyces sp. 8L]MCA1218652.1 GPP34 family phosphoprotein [Streptomyces sp. 8L]